MDLEKLVNQSFEHERDLPFDEAHWEQLNRQLDKQQRRKKWFSWWPWLSLLLLLLLLGNWYVQSQTISRLEARVDELSAVQPIVLTQIDTVWQTDTIIQREPYPIYLTENEAFANAPAAEPQETPETVIPQSAPAVEGEKIEVAEKSTDWRGVFKLHGPQRPLLVAKERVHLSPEPKLTPKKDDVATKIKFNRIGISYHSGRVIDPNNPSNKGVLEQQFQQVGVQLTTRIWHNLSLHLEAGQEWQNYRALDSLPDRYGFEAPFLYYTNGFSTHQQSIYYRIGLNYVLSRQWRFRPVIGVGVLGQSSLITAAKTRFQTDNPYLMPDEDHEKTIRRDALSVNYGYGTFGIETTLSGHWGLQFYGTFYRPFDGLWEYEKQHSWGAQLYYQF